MFRPTSLMYGPFMLLYKMISLTIIDVQKLQIYPRIGHKIPTLMANGFKYMQKFRFLPILANLSRIDHIQWCPGLQLISNKAYIGHRQSSYI